LEFSVFSPETTVINQNGETREMPFERPEHVEQPMIQAVVDELLGGAPAPSGADNALRCWSVIESLLGDYYKH
jgi:1,5-anhydro-D-fructose reductase (1,5-anhydro-D-mannitol-forming)